MADFLLRQGVKESDLVLEESSRTTYENAVESTKLLKERGLRNAVLVTDAVDMFRAVRCFRGQGMELLPSPCHYRAARFETSFRQFVPNPGAVRSCHRVWHEWLGTLWYWVHGRL